MKVIQVILLTLIGCNSFKLEYGLSNSSLCEFCKSAQNYVFNTSHNYLETALSALSSACQIKAPPKFCNYFVKNFGTRIFENKRKFFESTNYICGIVLNVCSSDYHPFNVTAFRERVNENFPKSTPSVEKANMPSTNSVKKLKVLVLNDIHIQSDYQYKTQANCGTPGGCCTSSAGLTEDPFDQAKYWGTPNSFCDIPDYLYYSTVQYIKENIEKPDLIFMLGDNTGHNYFNIDPEALADSTKIIIDVLKGNFTGVPIIPVLGNHECHHVDYFDFDDKENFVIEKIFPLFKEVIGQDKIEDLINNGFYSLEFEDFNLKVITLNSQINDAFNVASFASSNFFEEMLQKLAADIYQSEKAGQKVILLSHIPITDYFSIEEINSAIKVIVERFKDTITNILSGHTHSDQIRFLRGADGNIFNVNFLSPSLTTFESYNPSFRVYEFEDGKFSDYTQYKFDIDSYNTLADEGIFKFGFDVSYTFKASYGIQDWTKEEMERFHGRLANYDPLIIQNYLKNYFCVNELTDWEEKKAGPVCEIKDDLEEIFACMETFTNGDEQIKYIKLYRDLFIRKLLIPKSLEAQLS